MNALINRRDWLRELATLGPIGAFSSTIFGQKKDDAKGYVVGEPTAALVGQQILADGGNIFDAIVAGGLAAAITSPYQFGIGGYGGCATLATAGGKKIVSIDFNTTAPAAAKPEMFKPTGAKATNTNNFGWLASGVPGILAGLQYILDHFGTLKLDAVIKPAIQLARDGVNVQGGLATGINSSAAQLALDPGSKKLYFQNDKPLKAGDRLRNPDLAEMLSTLAKRGTVESFYRGDISERIAEGFQKNGGLVTAKDLANYRAREVKPLSLAWEKQTIHTAPLTAGGLTTLQALRTLQAMKWNQVPAGIERTHARIEALRLAWRDRLTLLGDPETGKIPIDRLLSEEYARESVARIQAAVKERKILSHNVIPRDHTGTISLSGGDREGNLVAITLTHGNSFGARVTVDGLGLTLGHGMSRFDTDPAHPNAPGPGKRPLHNMCPTIVTREGQPCLAIGGRGGRKIPNAVFEALTQFVVLGQSLKQSIAAPRMHTEGTDTLDLEKHWPADESADLQKLGYKIKTAASATLSAVVKEKDALSTEMR